MKDIDKIISLCDKYEDETIALRRKIHENPELSNQEYETSKMVEDYLLDLALQVERLGETGVLATLKGKEKGRVLLLRADMDALPIEEETDLDFKSKNKGVMHACGHDVHTANLLIVAKVLKDLSEDFNGTIKFLFQPAEERGGGAKKMIDLGVLENPKVNVCFGLHIMPTKQGEIKIRPGNITAYSDGFKLTVKGKKAHSRQPQEGIDAINIGATIIVALNSIMGKMISPFHRATFSIGKISGGSTSNIVADRVEIKGMIRSLDSDARETIKERIEKLSIGIAESFGGTCDFKFNQGYPSVYNDKKLTKDTADLFENNTLKIYKNLNLLNPKENILREAEPIMAADDFGFFSEQVPTLYYMIGTGDRAPGHSSKFHVDEEWIKLCTRTMVIATINYLNKR